MLGRALASELGKLWGQSVVVENPAGANSIVGAEKVATAAPDGYTLMMTIDTTTVSARFLYKLPYDPDKSFTPITMVARSGQFVIVNPSFPANNLRELIEYARRNPGKVAYASYGLGTQPHLFFETLAKREGVSFLHVPYKGVAPCVTATVAGEVQATVSSPAASGAQVKAGKARAIAIGGGQRTHLFPNVPTIAESGYPYAAAIIWFGLFGPGGMNPQLVDRIYRDATSHRKTARVRREVHHRVQSRSGREYAGRIRCGDSLRRGSHGRDGEGIRREARVSRAALSPDGRAGGQRPRKRGFFSLRDRLDTCGFARCP